MQRLLVLIIFVFANTTGMADVYTRDLPKSLFYSDDFSCDLILKNAQWLRPLLAFENQITRKIIAPKSKRFGRSRVYQKFAQVKSNPKQLHQFLQAMPKGAELHYHLAGGAYPETMISIASHEQYCVDDKTFIAVSNTCHGLSMSKIATMPKMVQKTIQAWSLKDFKSKTESAHDHFYKSFYKFLSIVSDNRPQLLAAVMTRADKQHVRYMEPMILPDNAASTQFGTFIENTSGFDNKRLLLLLNNKFQNNIKSTRSKATRIIKNAHKILGCSKHPKASVCQMPVKFQYYVLREQPIDMVFAQALNAFEAASNSNDIVSVNLVQAEDGPISTRDYKKQMAVFEFMHRQYPKVHIALHAGEITSDIAAPEALTFHIYDAVNVGQAQRIGHGVDILNETGANELVKYMAEHDIAVEINLSSNKEILNVTGAAHPLNYYLSHNVPVVLSTDDEGILRTNITEQYAQAVTQHHLSYDALKLISRNGATYSFLPGKSIWTNARQAILVDTCANGLNNASCLKYQNNNPKAQLQVRLEKEFAIFEKNA